MYIIKEFNVNGFWGNKNIDVELDPNVNIFIGPNGSGKTTLINILQACMTLDFPMLNSLQFESVTIKLIAGKSQKKIVITKYPTEMLYDDIEYKISREKIRIPLVSSDSDYRRRIPQRHLINIKELREKLSAITKTSWLSVHRELLNEENYESHLRGRRFEEILNPIDARLYRLFEKLKNYQLKLQTEVTKISFDFQRSVLTSLLFSKRFDTFNLERESDINFDELKQQLIHAYSALGVLTDNTKTRIDNHIDIINKSINNLLEASNKGEKSFLVQDILPLSLLKRSRHLASLSAKTDEEKQKIFEPLNMFIETLKSFWQDKEIDLAISEEGGIKVSKNGLPINIKNLSSGEKQVFILLAETILQEKKRAIFLADEPELSLHIDWQQKLIAAIRMLNPEAQMIVATHSPEIAGSWQHKIKDMEDVLI